MRTIRLKVSADRKTLQVVQQSRRGRFFSSERYGTQPEPDGSTFKTKDGELLSCEDPGDQGFPLHPMGPLEKYGQERYDKDEKPWLCVRGVHKEHDTDLVKIPSPEWLKGIQKTVAAYNRKYGPKKSGKGSK
jgi:hypothetical protein